MSSSDAIAHDPRFPIGKFKPLDSITAADRSSAMADIAEMPELLREAVRSLSSEQKNTPYRDGGWTVRQVVHHLADSHMAALHRVHKALTEDWPEVNGYPEAEFAKCHDASAPTEWSLQILEGVHARWVMLLQSLDDLQWKRGFRHAERGRMSIEQVTMLYAWHCRHHVAHITHLRAEKQW